MAGRNAFTGHLQKHTPTDVAGEITTTGRRRRVRQTRAPRPCPAGGLPAEPRSAGKGGPGAGVGAGPAAPGAGRVGAPCSNGVSSVTPAPIQHGALTNLGQTQARWSRGFPHNLVPERQVLGWDGGSCSSPRGCGGRRGAEGGRTSLAAPSHGSSRRIHGSVEQTRSRLQGTHVFLLSRLASGGVSGLTTPRQGGDRVGTEIPTAAVRPVRRRRVRSRPSHRRCCLARSRPSPAARSAPRPGHQVSAPLGPTRSREWRGLGPDPGPPRWVLQGYEPVLQWVRLR